MREGVRTPPHEAGGQPPGLFAGAQPVRIDCRYAPQFPAANMTEGLGDAGHRACGSHHGAGAGGDSEPPLDQGDFLVANRAGSIAWPRTLRQSVQAPSRSPWWRPVSIGPTTSWMAGMLGGDCAHELRRHRLVATPEKNDSVHRLRADHLLDVHAT